MSSSLAAQLAQGASLNAAILVDRSRRKHSDSYLFTGREADHHDLYSLHALGLNAFLQLKSLDPAFRSFEDALFSDAAKATNRTLLPKEQVAELDESISTFLKLLGPYLMDAPTGKVLEWMVRRFRCVQTTHTRLFVDSRIESTNSISMIHLLSFFPTTNPLILPRW